MKKHYKIRLHVLCLWAIHLQYIQYTRSKALMTKKGLRRQLWVLRVLWNKCCDSKKQQGLNCHLFWLHHFFYYFSNFRKCSLKLIWKTLEFNFFEFYSLSIDQHSCYNFTIFFIIFCELFESLWFLGISYKVIYFKKTLMRRFKHSVGIFGFWSVKVSNVSFIIKILNYLEWLARGAKNWGILYS